MSLVGRGFWTHCEVWERNGTKNQTMLYMAPLGCDVRQGQGKKMHSNACIPLTMPYEELKSPFLTPSNRFYCPVFGGYKGRQTSSY